MSVLRSWGDGCLVECTEGAARRLARTPGLRVRRTSFGPGDLRTLVAVERARDAAAEVSAVAPAYLRASGDPLRHLVPAAPRTLASGAREARGLDAGVAKTKGPRAAIQRSDDTRGPKGAARQRGRAAPGSEPDGEEPRRGTPQGPDAPPSAVETNFHASASGDALLLRPASGEGPERPDAVVQHAGRASARPAACTGAELAAHDKRCVLGVKEPDTCDKVAGILAEVASGFEVDGKSDAAKDVQKAAERIREACKGRLPPNEAMSSAMGHLADAGDRTGAADHVRSSMVPGAGPGRSDGCEAKLAACEAQVASLRGALSTAGGDVNEEGALHVQAVVDPDATPGAIKAARAYLKDLDDADAKRYVRQMKAVIDPLLQDPEKQEAAYERYEPIMSTKAWEALAQQELDLQSAIKIQGLLEARDYSAVKTSVEAQLLAAAAKDVTQFPFMLLLLLVDDGKLHTTIKGLTPALVTAALGSIDQMSRDERVALFCVVARSTVQYKTEPELAKAVAKLALGQSKETGARLLRDLFGKMEARKINKTGKSLVQALQYTSLMKLVSNAAVRAAGERIEELSLAEGDKKIHLDKLIKELVDEKIKPYVRPVLPNEKEVATFTKSAVAAIKAAGPTIEQIQAAQNVHLSMTIAEARALNTAGLEGALIAALFKGLKRAVAPAPQSANPARPAIVLDTPKLKTSGLGGADFRSTLTAAFALRSPSQPPPQPEAEVHAESGPAPPRPPPAKGPSISSANLLDATRGLKKMVRPLSFGPDKGALFAELARAVARRQKRLRFGHGATRHV